MQPKWKRILASAGAALLGASVLAVAADELGFRDEAVVLRNAGPADAEPCPPDACTIVLKTEAGGPPSRLLDVR